jgi:hypothetical protein
MTLKREKLVLPSTLQTLWSETSSLISNSSLQNSSKNSKSFDFQIITFLHSLYFESQLLGYKTHNLIHINKFVSQKLLLFIYFFIQSYVPDYEPKIKPTFVTNFKVTEAIVPKTYTICNTHYLMDKTLSKLNIPGLSKDITMVIASYINNE